MRSAEDDLGEAMLAPPARQGFDSRRAFLRGAGFGGATLTIAAATLSVPALVHSAAAQSATTTAPPRRPQGDDVALLAFAQSLELAAVAVYALAAPKLTDATIAKVAATFAQHHKEHASALNGLAAKAAPGVANAALVKKFTQALAAAKDQAAALKVAFDVENAAAATYQAALGTLVGIDGAALVASIQPIESRHAVVLGQVLGLNMADYLPTVQATSDALDASAYPIEG
jgi:rubrerythrin